MMKNFQVSSFDLKLYPVNTKQPPILVQAINNCIYNKINDVDANAIIVYNSGITNYSGENHA